MTTAAEPSSKRAEANRRNGRLGRGPTSPEGKARSRLNALKHGLTAQTVVLPGEDPAALEARVAAWKHDLRPADALHGYLIERAAHVSWQLDRADRTIAARLSARILAAPADRDRREAEEAAEAGRLLLWDPAGPIALYPHRPLGTSMLEISWSGRPDDPLEPGRLLARLEATAAGCRWLLDRWGELRSLLEDGRKWLPPDRFRAARLLGKQPVDAAEDDRLMAIHLACWAMEPEGAAAFGDLETELDHYERRLFARLTEARGAAERTPADAASGRSVLLAIVGEAIARLEAMLAVHREAAAAELAGLSAMLAFEEGEEGELMRRYQLGTARTFYRAVDTIYKAGREASRRGDDEDAPDPPAAGSPPPPGVGDETNPIAVASLAPAFAGWVDETNPIADDAPAQPLGAIDETNPIADAPAPRPGWVDETNPIADRRPAPAPGGVDETNPIAAESSVSCRVGTAHRSEAPDAAGPPDVRSRHDADAAEGPDRGSDPDAAAAADAPGFSPTQWSRDMDEVGQWLAERRAAKARSRAAADPPAGPIGETNPIPDSDPAPPPDGRRAPDGPKRPVPELIRRMKAEMDRRNAAGEFFPPEMMPHEIIWALANPRPWSRD